MALVQIDGYALANLSDELKADKEVVMAAVKNNGYALEYASDELKADKEVVTAAVQENADALVHALTSELTADKEVVLPENFYEDRITSGIQLEIFHVDTENYHLGACTVICLLLKHFGIEDIDPEKLQPTDLLFQLANLDEKILANLNSNIPHHFNELGTLTNPEILETANSSEGLSVQNVIDYVWNVVNDPDSSYVKEKK
jgi:hypothetical protein